MRCTLQGVRSQWLMKIYSPFRARNLPHPRKKKTQAELSTRTPYRTVNYCGLSFSAYFRTFWSREAVLCILQVSPEGWRKPDFSAMQYTEKIWTGLAVIGVISHANRKVRVRGGKSLFDGGSPLILAPQCHNIVSNSYCTLPKCSISYYLHEWSLISVELIKLQQEFNFIVKFWCFFY